MIFKCDRASLTDAINTVQKAVAARSTRPILEGILIKAKNGFVTLTGNDLEIGIEATINADIEKEGKIVVNSSLFGTVIRKMSDENVKITLNDSNNTVTIKCGSSEIRINGIEAEEFPEIPKFDTEAEISLSQKELKNLIKSTIFAVGTSEAKLILTGCLLESTDDGINMVAVDGFRLAFKSTKPEDKNSVVSMVIPSKALKEINNITNDTDDIVTLKYSPKNIRCEFDNVVITSRLLEGEYIDYKKIIPAEFKTKVKVDLKPMLEAVDRVAVVITSEAVKSPLVMNISGGSVQITCETSVGKVNEVVPATIDGPSLEIGFNNRYMYDALKAATGDVINMEFITPVSPCLITPDGEGDFKFIVLPVRLKGE